MTDTRSQQSAKTQVFRIFLASPGDVQDERDLARVVIDQIRHERAFRDRLSIEIIAWDQLPTDAGLTPQEAIKQGLPKPSECDIDPKSLRRKRIKAGWKILRKTFPNEKAPPFWIAWMETVHKESLANFQEVLELQEELNE